MLLRVGRDLWSPMTSIRISHQRSGRDSEILCSQKVCLPFNSFFFFFSLHFCSLVSVTCGGDRVGSGRTVVFLEISFFPRGCFVIRNKSRELILVSSLPTEPTSTCHV